MPVPSTINDLSATAASNSPAGSDAVGPLLDDYLRAHAAIIRQAYDAAALKTGATFTGAVNFAEGAAIASAATVNLDVATGNMLHITGTTAITAITLAQGAQRWVVFDAALTLTHGANLILPDNADILTAAGDVALFVGEGAGVVRCLHFARQAGGWQTYSGNVTFRNALINGAMQVDQYNGGASRTFTAGAALSYCVDQWYGYCTGANITGQRIEPSNNLRRYQFTGANSNSGVGFGQRIEAIASASLAGKSCSLQAKLSSSSLTTLTWAAYYANTDDSFGTLASPTRTQIATGTFTISATEDIRVTHFDVPAAATTGIEIVFTGGALLAGQTLTIGDVQLEAGFSEFEKLPISIETLACKRYRVPLQQLSVQGYTPGIGSTVYQTISFPVPMRVTPTVTANFTSAVNATGAIVSNSAIGLQVRCTSTAAGDYAITLASTSFASAVL